MCNFKGMLIKKALRPTYRTKIAKVYILEKGIWQFYRQSLNKIAQHPCIPVIQGETDLKLKVKKFVAKLFLPLPNASIMDIDNYIYTEFIKIYSSIIKHKIQNNILNALIKKCPESDKILYKILKLALKPFLSHFY